MKKTKMVVGFCKDIFIYTYWLLSNMILWIVFFSFMFQNPPVYFSPSNLLTQQLTHEAFDVEDMKWKHETFYVEAMHYCYPWRSPSLIALPRLCGNNVSCNMWRNYTTHSGRLTVIVIIIIFNEETLQIFTSNKEKTYMGYTVYTL